MPSSTPNWYHQTTGGRPRIESLTGLRWFAALAVCLSHNIPGGDTPEWLVAFFTNGYMGVTLFFVLSGFVLTVTYRDSLARPTGPLVWNYFLARIARIMPLYLLVLAFVAFRGLGPVPQSGLWAHILGLQTWSGNVEFAYALNAPGWSVGVELFLYAVFPVLIVLVVPFLRTTQRVLVFAGLVVLVMASILALFHLNGLDALPWADPASAHRWLYRSPLLRLGDFLLGISMGLIFLREGHRARLQRLAPAAAIVLSVFIVACMCMPSTIYSAASFDLLYAVPGALLILALALNPHRGPSRLLGLIWIVGLGELSYAFYLIHFPLGGIFIGGALSNGLTPSAVAIFLLGLFMLVALSWGLHVLFERPSRQALRKWLSFPTRLAATPKVDDIQRQ